MTELEVLLASVDGAVAAASEQSFQNGFCSLGELVAKLEGFVEQYPEDTELSYAIGLCWYNMPGTFKGRSATQARHWLERTLAIDPLHHYARLYLGHVLFDTGAYLEAVHAFGHIPQGYFGRFGQRWRDLKLLELVLSARLRIDPTSVTQEDFKDFTDAYTAEAEEDRPMPVELVQSVVEVCAGRSTDEESWLAVSLVGFLVGLDTVDRFESEINYLRGNSSSGKGGR